MNEPESLLTYLQTVEQLVVLFYNVSQYNQCSVVMITLQQSF